MRSTVLLICFCLMLVGLHAWSLWISRQGELSDSATSTANMARALASHAERSLNIANSTLDDVVERINQDGLDHFDIKRMHTRMAHIATNSAEIQELFVYDAKGMRLATSLPTLLAGSNMDREFFRYHTTHTDMSTHIGMPIRSRSSGILTIPISRRISRPDGSFGGVAMVSLKLNFFGKFYDSFDLGRTGTIILALDDGTLLYRRPFKTAMVGTSIANGPVYQLYKKSGPVGTAMLISKLDGIERLYSYRHLDGFPLLVATAQSKDEILEGWWLAVIKMSCVVVFALCMLAWGARRMIVQLRVREALEAELRAVRISLELHNMSLRDLADSDALTGLANRRRFDDT
ncbi:MAG: diguanylate cyclase, partial [Cytophagaceae bacterium]